MLGLIFNGILLTVNLLLRGGNNVWIPSNVQSLGCYSPFNLQSVSVANSDGTQVGLSQCFMCYTNFTLLRGVQCLCIEDRGIAELIRVNDSYCDIRCDGNSQLTNVNSSFMCGGNLGANLYCNKQAGSICNANSNQPAVEIYRDFDKNQGNGFELMVPCLDFGCGQPDFNDKFHLAYIEYFPNLNPADCIIYCTYMKTSYAHAGWFPARNKLYPECVCANGTGDPYRTGPPCVPGTCPSPLNPVRFNNRDDANDYMPSCGNKDFDDSYWSIFCTMTVFKEANETQCAAFQTPSNSSWDTCPTSSTSTQKASSSSLTTQEPHNTNCPSHNRAIFLGSFVKLWEMLDVGSCSNDSRLYNGSCYFIESLSENDMQDVDDWRNASAKYCNNNNHGHLLSIETEDEKNFITKEFLLAGFEEDEGYTRSYLTSGVKTNKSTEFWSLSDDVRIPMSNMSGWGVELLNCDQEYPSFLMLYYDLETQGYNSWEFTRAQQSRYFICEYAEPENSETTSPSTTPSATPTTMFSTTSTSTTPASTTPVSTTPASTTSASTTSASTTPAIITQSSSAPSTMTSTPTPSSLISSTTTDSVFDSSTTSIPPTMETTQVTTSTTTSTLVPESNHKNCPCVGTDIYHSNWTIQANKTKKQNCRSGAVGMASWSCEMNANGCYFRTTQPNFSDCHSKELREIANDVDDYETELSVVWESLSDFTQPNDVYFGHEIEYILVLISNLLERQDEQMNNTINHLEFQINTTYTGAHILDNLISHDMQWDQLNQVNRSQTALLLLNISEDMSFRLTDVAEVDGRSLRCEIYLPNVSLSSSYWDGGPNGVYDCYLNTMFESNVFQQFPLPGSSCDSTYILLPEEAVLVGRTHKAAGLLISHYIIQQLFPGQNSVAGDQKQINSPLISYSLRNDDRQNLWKSAQIPENTFVQIVYKHAQAAKDPPIQTIHRELNPGETPSPVIGSAFCAFISFYEPSNQSDRMAWIWDNQGCSLISTNRTHTLCKCNHLTGFSTLMDFHDYTGESRALEITSIVCSMASAISLAITFTVLTILRSIKTDRTIITQNLCIFLMISHILALTTLDRHYLHLDDVTCAAMGVTLHFCLLVSFMWMGIEGVRLCRMVIYVFNLGDWTLYYILAAFTFPFIIVGSTILAAYCTTGVIPAYVGDETCWLNGNNYKWSFAAPVVVIIIANVLFAVIAVRSSWNLKQNMDRTLEEKIRNAAALSLSLTCLLGISWLTGFFLYMETDVFEYIFTITNGLQGVTIMLFRCVLNDEVSTAIKESWRRHKSKRLGKWSSTMTNNTNSQHRKSVADTDSNPRINKKLTPTNSRLSTLSNATKKTDVTYASSNNIRHPERTPRKNNLRTFSGTEFSETEYSSEARGSFSSTGSYSHNLVKQESAAIGGARESRRVSFFFREQTLPPTSISTDIPEEHENTAVSRRTGNLMFYEQDPSVFF